MVQSTTSILVVGSVASFLLALGIGANDVGDGFSHPKHHCMLCTCQMSCAQVANSFGTSVGSKALTMRQAMGIAAVCEVAGAISLGRGGELPM